MKEVLKYPLHIQFFADNGAQPNTGDGNDNNGASPSAQGANSSVSIDYDKIADVLDKRGSQAQYAALKGYLKELHLLRLQRPLQKERPLHHRVLDHNQ